MTRHQFRSSQTIEQIHASILEDVSMHDPHVKNLIAVTTSRCPRCDKPYNGDFNREYVEKYAESIAIYHNTKDAEVETGDPDAVDDMSVVGFSCPECGEAVPESLHEAILWFTNDTMYRVMSAEGLDRIVNARKVAEDRLAVATRDDRELRSIHPSLRPDRMLNVPDSAPVRFWSIGLGRYLLGFVIDQTRIDNVLIVADEQGYEHEVNYADATLVEVIYPPLSNDARPMIDRFGKWGYLRPGGVQSPQMHSMAQAFGEARQLPRNDPDEVAAEPAQ